MRQIICGGLSFAFLDPLQGPDRLLPGSALDRLGGVGASANVAGLSSSGAREGLTAPGLPIVRGPSRPAPDRPARLPEGWRRLVPLRRAESTRRQPQTASAGARRGLRPNLLRD